MKPLDQYFRHCLYFSAGALARAMNEMAEEEFQSLGFSPSHAFLLMLALEREGITQKEAAAELHLAPSTVSRLADALVRKGLLRREEGGRARPLHPTQQGEALQSEIAAAWRRIYDRYSAVLGEEAGCELTARTYSAAMALQPKPS